MMEFPTTMTAYPLGAVQWASEERNFAESLKYEAA
jgi:hypothetical protein